MADGDIGGTPLADPIAEGYRQAGMVNPTRVDTAAGSYYVANPGGHGAGAGAPTGPSPFIGAKGAVDSNAPTGPSPFKADGDDSQPSVSAPSAVAAGLRSGLTLGATPDLYGIAAAGAHPESAGGNSLLSMPGDLVEGAVNLGKEALFGRPLSSLITGDSATAKYQAAHDAEKATQGAAADQQPWAYYPSEIAAGVAVPVGGALKTTATWGMRAWEGMKIGGTLGAVSGAFGGDDAKSRATGAATGLLTGGALGWALPGVSKGLSEGAAKVAHATHLDQLPDAWRAWKNPATVDDIAARHVGDTALKGRGEFQPGDEAFADQNSQPVANVDRMGEEGRSLLRTQTNISPTAQQDANKYFTDNKNSFAERTANFTRSFGPLSAGGRAPMREELDNLARQQQKPAYVKAYSDGDKVITSEKLEQLMGTDSVPKAVEAAMSEWRDWQGIDGFGAMNPRKTIDQNTGGLITSTGGKMPVFPNIQMWDYTARMLDGWAGEAKRAGNDTKAFKFSELSRQLKAELDRIVPSYEAARATAAKHFGAKDAYEAGGEFVSRKIDMSEAEAAHADFKPAEKALFQDNFFGTLATQVRQTGRRTQLIDNIERSPDAQDRIRLAGGPDALAKFTTYMRIQHITELSARALGNSTTFKQMVASGAIGIGAGVGEGLASGDASMTGILKAGITAALTGSVNAGKQRLNTQLANRITDMLLSKDPKVLQRAVEIARNNSAVKEGIRNVELRFERAVGEASGRAAGPLNQNDGGDQ